MGYHIGESCDDLLFGGEVGALLEFKVADGTRQGQVAVDSAKIDESASSANSGLFAYMTLVSQVPAMASSVLTFVLRLVVKGQRLRSALDAEYGSRISGVCLLP